jgi:hypothetical protein
VSVPEAYPLTDFDEATVKSLHAEALRQVASEDAVVKAKAQIEINVYTSLARSLGFSL